MPLDYALKLVPFVNDIRNMDDETMRLKTSGDHLRSLGEQYLQNNNLENVAFSLQSSQFRMSDWEHSTAINYRSIESAITNSDASRLMKFRQKQHVINKRAWHRCMHSQLVLMITKFRGRHNRKEATNNKLRQKEYNIHWLELRITTWICRCTT